MKRNKYFKIKFILDDGFFVFSSLTSVVAAAAGGVVGEAVVVVVVGAAEGISKGFGPPRFGMSGELVATAFGFCC